MKNLASKNRERLFWNIVSFVCFLYFGFFFLYPMFKMLIGSLFTSEGFSLAPFIKFFSTKYYMTAVWNSLKVGTLVTAITLVTGTIFALIMRTVSIKGKKLIDTLLLVSTITPPFLGAYAWIVLFGRVGPVTVFFNNLFNVTLDGLYGLGGIVFVFVVHSTPLMYMYISGALKNVDNSLNEAAENLGCIGIRRLFKVTLPLILPTLLSSGLLIFMGAISDFGTAKLIGEGYNTMATLIYSSFVGEVSRDTSMASAMSVITLAFTTLIFVLQRWLATRRSVEMSAMHPIVPKEAHGLKKVFSYFYVYFTTFLAILPILTISYNSIQKCTGQLFVAGYSLDSYRKVFSNMGTAFTNTYVYGVIALAIILVIGIAESYANVRHTSWLTKAMDTTTIFPFIVPGSVLGIAMIMAFNGKPFMLNGTAIIVISAWVIRRLPYTVRSSTSILHQINYNVEEASQSLGANGLHTFTKVTLPMMFTGVLPGALLSWVSAITELSCTVLIYSSRTTTMSIAIYSEVAKGNYGTASAMSTILLFSAIIVLCILFKLSNGKWDFSL